MVKKLSKTFEQQIQHFDNNGDMMREMEHHFSLEFKEKHGFLKTPEMCDVKNCSRKAKYLWHPSFFHRIYRNLTLEFELDCQYCGNHIKERIKALKLTKKYIRVISNDN